MAAATQQCASIPLNSGFSIPQVGFGTYCMDEKESCAAAVRAALACGYRHIDTARMYGNEKFIGDLLHDEFTAGRLKREDIFLTTKVQPHEMRYEDTKKVVLSSLKNLRVDHIDMVLVHFPKASFAKSASAAEAARLDCWRALEEVRAAGYVRSIGVSNFMARHLQHLLAHAKVKPAVNQCELHPGYYQVPCVREMLKFCEGAGIVVEAYSPLMRGSRRLLQHRVVVGVCEEVNAAAGLSGSAAVTPAQVCLRWSIQHGWVTLPKSLTPSRVEENWRLHHFTLSDAHMAQLDGLSDPETTPDYVLRKTCWDPDHVP